MLYPRRRLNNVTLLSVGDHNIVDVTQRALLFSSSAIKFKAIKLLGDKSPSHLFPGVDFIYIKPLSYPEYSTFCIFELWKYVETEFCLLIQYDGFVINPHLWDDSFLNYDYIGAPCRWDGVFQVGNGGFSLRSNKLLQLCQQLDRNKINERFEDRVICIEHRQWFLDNGCKFAPLNVAEKFACQESLHPNHNSSTAFGFHRVFGRQPVWL